MQQQLFQNRINLHFITAFIFSLLCNSSVSFAQSEASSKPETTHIALAGGGWRAHTGHAGWTMSLLDNGDRKLADVFSNVRTISSNSGGSWFNTMLAYSNKFVAAIEAKDAIENWSKSGADATGWLGQQQTIFKQAPCQLLNGNFFLECVSAYYTGGIKNATYWHQVVEKVVFRDNVLSEPLSSQRQPWAQDKSLLLAASMLTTEAVLSEVGIEKQYYQACLEPAKPTLNGNHGASCGTVAEKQTDVTPVTFASLPSNSTLKSPPFLSAIGDDGQGSYFNLGYTENTNRSPAKASATIENPISSDNVAVMTAAAASSAATGFAASAVVSGVWEISYLGSDESLHFQIDEDIKHVNTKGMKAADLAAAKIVQVADGGAVDNSAVAQLVSFLQQNNQADGFNVVAFDNVQIVYNAGENAAPVGIDIANLFGQGLSNGNQVCSDGNGGGFCITVPELAIFKLDALQNTPITWGAQASSHNPPEVLNELIYTKYSVTTVDNPTFGIKAGSSGILHAFTAVWSNANTSPKEKETDFLAYADMLNFINQGLQQTNKQGQTGISLLRKAMLLND